MLKVCGTVRAGGSNRNSGSGASIVFSRGQQLTGGTHADKLVHRGDRNRRSEKRCRLRATCSPLPPTRQLVAAPFPPSLPSRSADLSLPFRDTLKAAGLVWPSSAYPVTPGVECGLHHVCRVVGPPTTPSSRSVQCGQRPPRNGWQLRQGSGRGLPTRRRESGPRTPATLPGWQCRLTPGWDQLAPRTVNMASPVTADFFENGTNKQFEWVLGKYQEALQAKAEGKPGKAESLLKLDKW